MQHQLNVICTCSLVWVLRSSCSSSYRDATDMLLNSSCYCCYCSPVPVQAMHYPSVLLQPLYCIHKKIHKFQPILRFILQAADIRLSGSHKEGDG
jgi:hypothetical protein